MKNPEKTLKILIIEDNHDSAESLKVLLEYRKHKVETAFEGKSGIEKALEFAPNIILCDIGLPGEMDGYGVAEALRKYEQLQSVFLIALSGYGQEEDISQSKKSGFDRHITKPPDFEKLFALIEESGNSH